MLHLRTSYRLLTPLVLACLPLAAAAEGPDELWEVTVSMEMEGMSMPGQTQRICKPKATQSDEDLVPKDKNCKVTDSKKAGNKTTFTMVCEGKDKMTASGELVSDKDGYRGSMHAKGIVDDEPMDMTHKFAGRRVGSCTYEDPAKKYTAMMGEQCKKAMEELQWAAFTTEGAPCKDRKAEFCGKATKMIDAMRDPAGYKATVSKRGDWAQLAQACGQNPAAITTEACKRSVSATDWEFAIQHCEAEAKAIAQQQCDGRSYTVAMASEYAPLCRKYTNFGGRSYTAAVSSQTPSTPAATTGTSTPGPAKPSAADQLKDGANKLKKFLKF